MGFDVKGKQVVVDCTIYSRTNISLSWYIHRTELLPTDTQHRKKYIISEVSSTVIEGYDMSRFAKKVYTEYKGTLTIRKFSPEDLEVYTCVGTNAFGNSNASYNFSGMSPVCTHTTCWHK